MATENHIKKDEVITIDKMVAAFNEKAYTTSVYTRNEADVLLSKKQNNLTAGIGIVINKDTISLNTTASIGITGVWSVPTPALP